MDKQEYVLAPDGNQGLGYSAPRDTLAGPQGLVSIECAKRAVFMRLVLVTRPRRTDQHPKTPYCGFGT
jgi:hypothetical protein